MEGLQTGKRLGGLSHTLQQSMSPQRHRISDGWRVKQSSSQKSATQVGTNMVLGQEQHCDLPMNAGIATSATRHLPDYHAWGTFRLLGTSAKPPRAPLARLPSAQETVPERQQALNNAKIRVLARAARTPASGSLAISSSVSGRHADLSLVSALATLPPSNSIQEPPCSTLADEGVTTQRDAGKSRERTTESCSANSMSVSRVAGPIALSIISPPKANVGHSCGNAGECACGKMRPKYSKVNGNVWHRQAVGSRLIDPRPPSVASN